MQVPYLHLQANKCLLLPKNCGHDGVWGERPQAGLNLTTKLFHMLHLGASRSTKNWNNYLCWVAEMIMGTVARKIQ